MTQRQIHPAAKPALLGIDIGGTKTSVSLASRDGTLLDARRLAADPAEPPETWFSRCLALLENLMRDHGVRPGDIDHAGLSAPGPLSVRDGTILRVSNMPTWIGVPVKEWFAEHLACPITFNNDANAAALAEVLLGPHRGVKDLVYLTMSTGIGAGVLSGGHLLQGSTDYGGELGHIVLDASGPPCACGQRGCFERYCGGMSVAERLRERIRDERIQTTILDHASGDLSRISFACFAAAVREQDGFALEEWELYTDKLAHGLGLVIMAYNPSVITMGTIAVQCWDLIEKPLREKVRRYAWADAIEACHFGPTSLGSNIGDLAAIALCLS